MSAPALSFHGVVRRYPAFTFGPFDAAFAPGRRVGLLGANGAGKSTLLRLALGLVRADTGEITVLGRRMPAEEAALKADVAFVSEDMAPYAGATIAWHLGYVRALAPTFDEAYARELLRRFALRPEQRVRGLSRGQSVRLLLLLALVRRPRLLLLDEPTTGLDPRVRHALRAELLDLVRATGTAVLFSSHLVEDVDALAEEVLVLDGGRLIRRAPIDELRAEGPLDQVFLRAIGAVGEVGA